VPLNSVALKMYRLIIIVKGRRKIKNMTSLLTRISLSPFSTTRVFKNGKVLYKKLAGKKARI
jgi:hypothetical protein